MDEHSHCHDLLGSLSEYVDGTLRAELCKELEGHMQGCHNCRVVVDTLRKTIEIYHESGTQDAELPVEVRQRLFYRLNLDDVISKK